MVDRRGRHETRRVGESCYVYYSVGRTGVGSERGSAGRLRDSYAACPTAVTALPSPTLRDGSRYDGGNGVPEASPSPRWRETWSALAGTVSPTRSKHSSGCAGACTRLGLRKDRQVCKTGRYKVTCVAAGVTAAHPDDLGRGRVGWVSRSQPGRGRSGLSSCPSHPPSGVPSRTRG